MSESKLMETCQNYLNKLEVSIINEHELETLSILNSLQVCCLFSFFYTESPCYFGCYQKVESCRLFETAFTRCEQFSDKTPDKKGNSPLEKLYSIKLEDCCYQTACYETFLLIRIR